MDIRNHGGTLTVIALRTPATTIAPVRHDTQVFIIGVAEGMEAVRLPIMMKFRGRQRHAVEIALSNLLNPLIQMGRTVVMPLILVANRSDSGRVYLLYEVNVRDFV